MILIKVENRGNFIQLFLWSEPQGLVLLSGHSRVWGFGTYITNKGCDYNVHMQVALNNTSPCGKNKKMKSSEASWHILELQNYLNNSGTYQNWGRQVKHDPATTKQGESHWK